MQKIISLLGKATKKGKLKKDSKLPFFYGPPNPYNFKYAVVLANGLSQTITDLIKKFKTSGGIILDEPEQIGTFTIYKQIEQLKTFAVELDKLSNKYRKYPGEEKFEKLQAKFAVQYEAFNEKLEELYQAWLNHSNTIDIGKYNISNERMSYINQEFKPSYVLENLEKYRKEKIILDTFDFKNPLVAVGYIKQYTNSVIMLICGSEGINHLNILTIWEVLETNTRFFREPDKEYNYTSEKTLFPGIR